SSKTFLALPTQGITARRHEYSQTTANLEGRRCRDSLTLAKMTEESRGSDAYLTAEAQARVQIDKELDAAGWLVQDAHAVNLAAGQGVAVREFILKPPHGRVDYLLFVDRQPVGTIEAKPAGTTLTGVEEQSAKYT